MFSRAFAYFCTDQSSSSPASLRAAPPALSDRSQPRGRVHLHVEYEPKGIQPGPNDVVFLESFARSAGSLSHLRGRDENNLRRILYIYSEYIETETETNIFRNRSIAL